MGGGGQHSDHRCPYSDCSHNPCKQKEPSPFSSRALLHSLLFQVQTSEADHKKERLSSSRQQPFLFLLLSAIATHPTRPKTPVYLKDNIDSF